MNDAHNPGQDDWGNPYDFSTMISVRGDAEAERLEDEAHAVFGHTPFLLMWESDDNRGRSCFVCVSNDLVKLTALKLLF